MLGDRCLRPFTFFSFIFFSQENQVPLGRSLRAGAGSPTPKSTGQLSACILQPTSHSESGNAPILKPWKLNPEDSKQLNHVRAGDQVSRLSRKHPMGGAHIHSWMAVISFLESTPSRRAAIQGLPCTPDSFSGEPVSWFCPLPRSRLPFWGQHLEVGGDRVGYPRQSTQIFKKSLSSQKSKTLRE